MEIGGDRDRVVSSAQQRLWFLDQLRPGSADYLLPLAMRVRGDLDVAALTGALAAIVERHEVLRTRYVGVDGEPAARVDGAAAVELERVDLGAAAGADRERRAAELVAEQLRRPIDLAVSPLRATLARLADDEHLLLVVIHHIAVDGTSWGVLGRELAAGYRERTGGAPADLAPLPMQYGDFAAWQRERLAGPRLTRQLDHWRERLAGLPPLELPTDRPRPPVWEGAGDVVRFEVPADLVAEVDGFARARRCTRFMVLLAAFQALLGRHTGQTDFAVGTPVAGRALSEVQDLIGLFVNTVVLRADLSGSPSFTELLDRVRGRSLEAFTHSEAPFERVVTELTPERDLARNPLFQVSFALLNAAGERIGLPGLDVELVETPLTSSAFDLTLDLKAFPDGRLVARLQYATALFDRDTMGVLAEGYLRLLRELLADPDAPVREAARAVPALPARHRRALLAQGNDTAAPIPDLTLPELVERQAQSTPDSVALVCGDVELTYAELVGRVRALARHLRAQGVDRGRVVGVHLDRGPDLLVALLAVLAAGGAYVPIDPEYPAGRVAFLVQDSGAEVLVSEVALAERLPATAARLVLLDRDRARVDACSRAPLDQVATLDDLAYLIYTSGSTGAPKGVMIHHRGLVNFLAAMERRPGLRPGATAMGVTTVSFDPSVLELYLPLLVGGRLALADTEQTRDPQRMARLIAAARPALLQATPTTLRMLVETGWTAPPGLTVLSGGEKVPADLVRALSADGAQVWDLYGPTETTVWATTARLDPDGVVLDWAPECNSTVHLLDHRMEPVPVGGVGEVHLGGVGLAWGYRGRPALTAETFVPDPHGTEPGGRLYRTGDLARRRQDGSVEILGRRDHQVKIRGHRIEPGEIEGALLAHAGVRAAVVHPTPTPSGEQQLTAYLVPRGEHAPTPEELRGWLLRDLPDYMVPAAYVVLDELPRTPSGKVDRKALPVPEAAPAAAVEHLAPRTDDERAVARVWGDVLGGAGLAAAGFGVDADFFELGGHSLLATRVAVRLRAALGVDVPVRALFDHATVAALARALPGYPRVGDHPAPPALTPRRRTARGPARTAP